MKLNTSWTFIHTSNAFRWLLVKNSDVQFWPILEILSHRDRKNKWKCTLNNNGIFSVNKNMHPLNHPKNSGLPPFSDTPESIQLRKPRRLTFLHRNQVQRTGFEFVFTGIELDTQNLSSFPQELSWTHRIGVHLYGNWDRSVSCDSDGNVSSDSNSIPGETNSNPVHRTWFLCKKVSIHGFRRQPLPPLLHRYQNDSSLTVPPHKKNLLCKTMCCWEHPFTVNQSTPTGCLFSISNLSDNPHHPWVCILLWDNSSYNFLIQIL